MYECLIANCPFNTHWQSELWTCSASFRFSSLRWPLTIFFKNSFNSILRSDIRCKHNQRKYCRRVHMWGTRLWILCRCGERLSTFSRVLSSPISWWKGGNAKMEFYLSKPNHLWPGKPLHLIKGLNKKIKSKFSIFVIIFFQIKRFTKKHVT